jgi:hypothetical protein
VSDEVRKECRGKVGGWVGGLFVKYPCTLCLHIWSLQSQLIVSHMISRSIKISAYHDF